ncbi:recombinase family protein [Pseudonocardia sp. HH130629-09]|uniref:recombinase family protein n=1 Tax=Pseudonocardia sp. HH130629-09 TaxID=1641402 RepID=UPI0007616940|nr:recombinase family protein [Pseudonocardia sp. HH130629-09]
MAPEALQLWIQRDAGPESPGVGASGPAVRVVFLGRTSGDELQDPVGSMQRQLSVAMAALPESCVLVGHFYDVESGRIDLSERGRGVKSVEVPIPRDGGVLDLLARAESPDPGFDAVICEQIDRIARRVYFGTMIEHRLQAAGIALWAADENIRPGGRAEDALPSTVLTRRVKQSVAEWYALDMLSRARDGFETHTEQGYAVGKPPYGYRGETVSVSGKAIDATARGGHRGKGRDGVRTKTRLLVDPVEGEVVRRIFAWRVGERVSYQGIADRLNLDLVTNRPPTPPDPDRAVGAWTAASVREVLVQPKHTGYMVWNKQATKTRGGAWNPLQDWVWSSRPTHEPLIELQTWIAAQEVAARRFGSRSAAGKNSRHPQTVRSYRLRSYLFCQLCGRRMYGKSRRERSYYVCAPKRGQHIPDGHPASLWVAEQTLLDAINGFLADHVFGTYRAELLGVAAGEIAAAATADHTRQVEAAQKAIADVDRRRGALVRALEVTDAIDPELIADIGRRRQELGAERIQLAEHSKHCARSRPNSRARHCSTCCPSAAGSWTSSPRRWPGACSRRCAWRHTSTRSAEPCGCGSP